MTTGLLHVYCGDGKGKTSAAMGLALRAAGSGLRVHLVQFLKSGNSGELHALAAVPGVTVFGDKTEMKFTFQMDASEKENTTALHNAALQAALAQPCDVLILDEVTSAYNLGMVDADVIQQLVCHRPAGMELVLTGRDPAQFMLDAADYVTEMTCRKHPYDKGVAARQGIEF